MGQIQGGYINFRAGEILSLLIAYKEGLRPAAIRLYLAGHLEATEQHFSPGHKITIETLCERADIAYRTAQEALRELKTRQLLTLEKGALSFCPEITPEAEPYIKDLKTSPNRPVPIPRSMIRELAEHSTGSEIVGALAHFMRCLFIKKGEINAIGFVKPSLITKLTGLGESAIRAARSWLKEIGFLADHEADQWAINKFGGCFSVSFTPKLEPELEANDPPLELSKYVKSGPPQGLTPIYVNNDLNNQYLESVPGKKSGIFTNTIINTPNIADIKPDNLRSLSQLEALYRQALDRNWFKHSENQVLEFISAAVRAITTPANDPVRVFVSLVRRGLTAHVTQSQENRAQEKLSRYRRRHPDAFRPQKQSPPPIPPPKPTRGILETIKSVLPLNLLAQLEAKLRKPMVT